MFISQLVMEINKDC